jgi:hypothetical protein
MQSLTAMEHRMVRGMAAPLSPNEEATLRRMAQGIADPKHLPQQHIDRLKSLGLVEDAGLRLTPLGQRRYGGLPKTGSTSEVTKAQDFVDQMTEIVQRGSTIRRAFDKE